MAEEKLKKCPSCESYTLKEVCSKCKEKTISPEYKFPKIPDEPKREFKRR